MKKYTLFLLVLTFIFGLFSFINAHSAQAYDSGCISGGLYSITTGQYCGGVQNNYQNNNYDPGCTGAGPYSTLTGRLCYGSGTNYSPVYSNTPVAQFYIGQRGSAVVALQQMLNNAGFSVGVIDGVYGYGTDAAYVAYQNQYPANTNPYPNYNSYPPVYNQVPTISGVSGPQTLNINQQGTWSVTAYNQNGVSLTYSVNWGDQSAYPYSANNSPTYLQSQQNATFTHSYSQAGTYTAIFTVTNSLGQSAQSTLSVVVSGGGIYNNSQVALIYSFYSIPLTVTSGQSSTVSWTSNNATSCVLSSSPNAPSNSGSLYQLSGSAQFTLYQTTTFTLDCSNSLGQHDIKNTVAYVVSGTINNQTPNISYLSPTSGRAGTQVTIYGTGLTYNGCTSFSCNSSSTYTDTIYFGSNIIPNVYSSNGTSITFTIPSYGPGIYPVSVNNGNGISNSINFSVTY